MKPSSKLKQTLGHWAPYVIAREIKNGYRRARTPAAHCESISLQSAGPSRGNVLLSYLPEPLIHQQEGLAIANKHSQQWESMLMVRTFLEMNYSVDVIHWQNDWFQPEKDYSFLIDLRWNLQRLAPLLDPGCHKIMHIDVCHILYQNAAEATRLLDVQRRRGVTLTPRRFEWPNLAIEHADCATVLGNEFTMDTFRYAGKPLYPVPIVPCASYPWPEGKDFGACRKRFLWFGNGGFVRKGLDLVLEVFARMPDYHLTICGPLDGDEDFVKAYHKELFETPNIESIGWVDTDGPDFKEICRNSLALIYPSCAEGQCGGVVTAMHAAVIPVISYESGVDTNDFGITLPGCSLQEVEDAVRQVSELPETRLEEMARSAWEYARRNHTREKFARDFRAVIEGILNPSAADYGKPSWSFRDGENAKRENSRELAVSAAR